MNINLKQLKFQCNTLDMVVSDMSKKGISATTNDLRAIYELISQIEGDLRSEGKAEIELDIPHEEAVKAAYYGN